MNDARHLPGDAVSKNDRLRKAIENDVESLQGRSLSSHKVFSVFEILSVQVLCNTVLGEELLVNYGNK